MREAEPLPVGQWGDDQPGGVPQVLVGVLELCVADVGVAVLLHLVPAVPELGLPGERLGVLHLRGGQSRRGGQALVVPSHPAGTASSHTRVRKFVTSAREQSVQTGPGAMLGWVRITPRQPSPARARCLWCTARAAGTGKTAPGSGFA